MGEQFNVDPTDHFSLLAMPMNTANHVNAINR